MPDKSITAAFEVLGLKPDAAPSEVTQAFRDLAQVWHPDRFAHNPRLLSQATAKMAELNQAKNLLHDYLADNRRPSQNHAEQAKYRKDAHETGNANAAGPTGERGSHNEDDEVVVVNCVHCGKERRFRVSNRRAAVPFSVRCRQCGMNFRVVPPSDTTTTSDTPASSPATASSDVDAPWHKDPILKYTWIIPSIILIPFFIFLIRHPIFFVAAQVAQVCAYLIAHIYVILVYFIALPLGVVALLVGAFYWIRADLRRAALSKKCPACGKLSALRYVGETIISETAKPKTVTRRSTSAGMLEGQLIPVFSAHRVQIIVYEIEFRELYGCRFCSEQTLSDLFWREVEP